MGDAMMMLGVGALLGWKLTILSLYLGFMSGGIIVIPLLAAKNSAGRMRCRLARIWQQDASWQFSQDGLSSNIWVQLGCLIYDRE